MKTPELQAKVDANIGHLFASPFHLEGSDIVAITMVVNEEPPA